MTPRSDVGRTRLGWMLAIGATLAYSTNAPIARAVVISGLEPQTLVAGRFLLGTLLLTSTVGLTRIGVARNREEVPLDVRGASLMVISGMLNGLAILALFTALKYIGASVQAILSIALIPTATLLLLSLKSEPLTRLHAARIALGVGGAWLLIGAQGGFDAMGVALMLVGSLLYAAHLTSVQWYLGAYNVWIVTTVLVSSATTITVVFWLATGASLSGLGWRSWLAIGVQGFVAAYLGRILTYAAINRIGSGQFSLLAPLETALVMIWSSMFLGERLGGLQWIGTAIILLSVMVARGMGREADRTTTGSRSLEQQRDRFR